MLALATAPALALTPSARFFHSMLASSNLVARFVDPLHDEKWDAQVLAHPGHSIFHSAAWARVLHRTYGHTPFYLELTKDGQAVALAPICEVQSPLTGRRGVSVPFSDLCAPLLFDRTAEGDLHQELARLAKERNWKYLEVRGAAPGSHGTSHTPSFYGHDLELLPDLDSLFNSFDPATRRAVRKAERHGLAAVCLNTWDAMNVFYQLHLKTRRRHGAPPQPVRFFRSLHEEIVARGLGFVSLVYQGSTPIAGAVFLHFGHHGVYKFGASNPEAQELRGNNLAMWTGMKELVSRGIRHLHFGRTALDNSGLRRYKLSWGAQEQALTYARLNSVSSEWSAVAPESASLRETIFRHTPLSFNRLVGAFLYPHLD